MSAPVHVKDLANKKQSIAHSITYSVITSTPELSYSSVLSTIRLHAVTAGEHADSTYVEWDARFSSDANAGGVFQVPALINVFNSADRYDRRHLRCQIQAHRGPVGSRESRHQGLKAFSSSRQCPARSIMMASSGVSKASISQSGLKGQSG